MLLLAMLELILAKLSLFQYVLIHLQQFAAMGLWPLTICLLLLHCGYGPGHFHRPGRSNRPPARNVVLVRTAVVSNESF